MTTVKPPLPAEVGGTAQVPPWRPAPALAPTAVVTVPDCPAQLTWTRTGGGVQCMRPAGHNGSQWLHAAWERSETGVLHWSVTWAPGSDLSSDAAEEKRP